MRKIFEYLMSIPLDKILHFLFGILISQILFIACRIASLGVVYAMITGVFFATFLSVCKEIIYDSTTDNKDILATFIGSIVGVVLMMLAVIM